MRSAAPDRPTSSSAEGARRLPLRRAGIAAAAVVATLVSGSMLAAPARAEAAKHLRLDVVTASSRYLVYRQKVTTASGLTYTEGSALYVTGRTGGRKAITDFDPQLFPSLRDSTLTQSAEPNSRYDVGGVYDPAAPEHVRWRDLSTGDHGVTEIPAADDYVAAAPGGWIATRTPAASADAVHVIRYRTSGSTTDLGAPFAAGVPWEVRPGVAGVLAFSAGDPEEFSEDGTVGVIRYQPYDAPGRWRTVYAPGPAAKMYCGSPSATHVTCEVHGAGSSHSGQVLIPLGAGVRRWLDAHPTACQTVGLRTVGSSAFAKVSGGRRPCVTGQIQRLSSTGVLTRSKRTFGARGDYLDGLGGFLFVSADQRKVLRITSAASAPRVVVEAR